MVFDGHSDLWIDIKRLQNDMREGHVLKDYYIDKLMADGISGSILVFWAEPQFAKNPSKRIHDLMALAKKEIENAKDKLSLVRKPQDVTDTKKFRLLLGMEGLAQIGKDHTMISKYYEEDIRHASLTWNEENDLATGVQGDFNVGLKDAGYSVIREMEKHRMILDVSHLNEKSFWGVSKIITRPILASHSNARALCNHPRNLTDDQIRMIAESGGLIGMNSFKQFVSDKEAYQNIDGLRRHIAHIINLVGVNHLAFGFDFCDYIEGDVLSSFAEDASQPGIKGLNQSADVLPFLEALRNIGLSKDELEMIQYKNYERFLEKNL